jgi:hypothetical protein
MVMASVMFITAFTTAFAVEISDNKGDTTQSEVVYPTTSESMTTTSAQLESMPIAVDIVETPNEIQALYPKYKFSLVKLGDLGKYSLYYNITEYYQYMDYKVTMGEYVFDCFAQQSPSDLGLYVVGNSNAYTLKDAYDQGLVNIDSAIALIQAGSDIHYNFTITKTETLTTYTQPITTEPKETVPVEKPLVKTPKLNFTKANLKSGQSKSLKVTNGTVKSWSSSNKNVVSVSNGKVTALNKGTTTITATLTTGKKLTCKVNVTTSPKLGKATVKVKNGGTVTVKLSGKVSTIKNKYTNTKYAKITSNANATTLKIKGLKKGTTTLKVKVNGVKTLKLKVNVK